MKRLQRLGWAVVLACGACAPAWAAQPTAAEQGKRLALDNCAACHVVSFDQSAPPTLQPNAPSFVSIANDPRLTAESLRKFVTSVHANGPTPPNMPSMLLSDDEATVVIAYILSLKKAP
jgi:mono/diheme cytochrome c family protein